MFVDIHSHILPNIDDGAKDIEMTLAMLKRAEKEGASTIIATPHYITDYYEYDADQLLKAYDITKDLIEEHHLNISLYLGNELFIDLESKDALKDGHCLSLAHSKYVLIELPNRWNNTIMEELLYDIELCGFKVILAHIERYNYFHEHPEVLREYISRGIYAQVNASSIISSHKKTVNYCRQLIKKGYVHFVASDAHSMGRRSPKYKEAYKKVHQWIGDAADKLFITNGKKVINDEYIDMTQPLNLKRKLFFLKGD